MVQTDETLYAALECTAMCLDEKKDAGLKLYFATSNKTDVEIFQELKEDAEGTGLFWHYVAFAALQTFNEIVREIAGDAADDLIDKYYNL